MSGQQSFLEMDIEPAADIPQTPYTRARYWVEERERLRQRKAQGLLPWTTDPILRKYRWCNVRRRDDRVSQWILPHIIEPYRDHPNLWLMLAIARWVNWPPTLQELMTEGAWPTGAPDWKKMASIVDARQQRGDKTWTGAYKISGKDKPTSPYFGMAKAHVVFRSFLGEAVWALRAPVQAALQTRRQQAVHRVFTSLYGWADFMAGQVVTDYPWTPLLQDATDLYTWAPQGPGSLEGLNRLHGLPLTTTWKEQKYLDALRELRARLVGDVPALADLTLMDVQNICCEGNKFLRTVNGEGYPRTLYRPEIAY